MKRGLLGEIFWGHKYNNIDPKLFFGYFFILYLIKIILLYLILKKKIIIILYFYIILTFANFIFKFMINIYFVKDILTKITIIFRTYLFLYCDKEKYFKFLKYVLIPILGISILIPEYQVLFLGIHLLFTLTKLNKFITLEKIYKIYSFLFSILL